MFSGKLALPHSQMPPMILSLLHLPVSEVQTQASSCLVSTSMVSYPNNYSWHCTLYKQGNGARYKETALWYQKIWSRYWLHHSLAVWFWANMFALWNHQYYLEDIIILTVNIWGSKTEFLRAWPWSQTLSLIGLICFLKHLALSFPSVKWRWQQ